MRKTFIIIILLFCVHSIYAQLSVESCSVIENDLDARNYPILDDDGSACALVKIVTTAKGFNFEIGQLPIKKVDESKVGEIWVYVPDGTMKMKITHPDLGSLRGADVENGFYMFSQRLKKAKVYRLELTHKEVLKVVGPQIPVKLTFNCNVEGAEVILGEGSQARTHGTITNNQYTMTWPKDHSISYRIKKDRYEDFEGTYKVENDENSIDVELKPLFGHVTIKTLPGAKIRLNGKEVGYGSYDEALDNGNYSVKVSKDGYRDAQQSFTISSADNKVVEIYPDMIYGSLSITSSPSGASVYIDGVNKGTTPITINGLVPGNHKVELRKNSYLNISKNVSIIGDQTVSTEAVFTTKQNVQTLRDHKLESHFFINVGFSIGSLNAPNLSLGYYINPASGLLIDAGGFYGINKSDEIYWYNSDYDNIGKSTYSPYGFYGNVGIAVNCALKFTIIPKIGIRYIGLSSNWSGTNTTYSDPANGANALSLPINCMFSYTMCPHLIVSLTPEYALSLKESNGFKEIGNYSSNVKNFSKGFNANISLSIYF